MFIFGVGCVSIFMFNFAFASLLFFIWIFRLFLLRTSTTDFDYFSLSDMVLPTLQLL
jgi:hypothetical protein